MGTTQGAAAGPGGNEAAHRRHLVAEVTRGLPLSLRGKNKFSGWSGSGRSHFFANTKRLEMGWDPGGLFLRKVVYIDAANLSRTTQQPKS